MGSQVTLTARTKLAAVRRRNHTTAAAERRTIPGSTRGERRGNIAYEASGKEIALLSGFIAAELRQAVAAAQEAALSPILANYVAAMTETTCNMHGLPRRYTLGAGHRLTDFVPQPRSQQLAMTAYGPNGFVHKIRGDGTAPLEVTSSADTAGNISLHLRNLGDRVLIVHVRDAAYGRGEHNVRLEPDGSTEWVGDLQASHGWYDLSLITERHDWRFADHIESGHESYSDPASGAPAPLQGSAIRVVIREA